MPAQPIIVVLTDGLGNQMFQYAAGRALALSRKVPLLYDGESGFRWNIHGRRCELKAFQLAAEAGQSRAGRILHGVVRRAESQLMRRGHYYTPLLHQWLDRYPNHVTGFFQSPSYFAGAEAHLRQEFQLRDPVPGPVAAIAAEAAGRESIGVHIRKQHAYSATGAMVSPHYEVPRYHQELDSYYRAAVATMKQRVAKPHWVIVTDTEPFDPVSIGIEGPVTIHYPDAANAPAVDQWLLSQCKHVVVGRSTFSWWAAWLRGPERGVTCAPRMFWAGGAVAPSMGLYPAEWTIID